jgi:hypothetical protein
MLGGLAPEVLPYLEYPPGHLLYLYLAASTAPQRNREKGALIFGPCTRLAQLGALPWQQSR